jgi:hypothetical protein
MSTIGPERPNRKAALKAISRAVRIYWEHEKSQPIPDHLAQLASKVDAALAKPIAIPSIVPSSPVEHGETLVNITQVKDVD